MLLFFADRRQSYAVIARLRKYVRKFQANFISYCVNVRIFSENRRNIFFVNLRIFIFISEIVAGIQSSGLISEFYFFFNYYFHRTIRRFIIIILVMLYNQSIDVSVEFRSNYCSDETILNFYFFLRKINNLW